jgi:ketosteroid isomerase-like protein
MALDTYRAVVLIGLSLGALACESLPENAVAPTPEAAVKRIVAADNAGDLDMLLDCYTEDAILMPPNEGVVQGREAIKPRYQHLFADFKLEIAGTSVESWSCGDRYVDRGITRGRLVPRNGQPPKELDDKYVMILRRDGDGAWRVERLMWSSNRAR